MNFCIFAYFISRNLGFANPQSKGGYSKLLLFLMIFSASPSAAQSWCPPEVKQASDHSLLTKQARRINKADNGVSLVIVEKRFDSNGKYKYYIYNGELAPIYSGTNFIDIGKSLDGRLSTNTQQVLFAMEGFEDNKSSAFLANCKVQMSMYRTELKLNELAIPYNSRNMVLDATVKTSEITSIEPIKVLKGTYSGSYQGELVIKNSKGSFRIKVINSTLEFVREFISKIVSYFSKSNISSDELVINAVFNIKHKLIKKYNLSNNDVAIGFQDQFVNSIIGFNRLEPSNITVDYELDEPLNLLAK